MNKRSAFGFWTSLHIIMQFCSKHTSHFVCDFNELTQPVAVSLQFNCLGVFRVRRSPRERETGGSLPDFPGRVLPVTSKIGRLALKSQRCGWFTLCRCSVTGWDGKFEEQLLSLYGRTYICLGRSVTEIQLHVATSLSKQPTNKH